MRDNGGLAPVVDINQARRRAQRGAQLGRGQHRRVSPAARPAKVMIPAGWTVEEWHKAADDRPRVRVRRGPKNLKIRVPAPKMSRAQRRLAWKAERRSIRKVSWEQSRAKDGQLAAVIPLRTRSLMRRLIRKAA